MLYEDSERLREALEKYLRINGLPPDGGGSDPWARYKIGPFSFVAYPNFPHRMWAIKRHDTHHILNNLDTTLLGEGYIAAWELGSGCGRSWISWFLEPQALLNSLLRSPKKTFGLFLQGQNSKNFFKENLTESDLNKTVGELRSRMLPPEETKHQAPLMSYVALLGYAILGVIFSAVFLPIVLFFTVMAPLLRRGP